MVFFIPLIPFLPLVTAHPTEHNWNALLIGEFDNVFAGYFRFPTEKVDTKVFYIAKDICFAPGIVTIEQVWCIVTTADKKITPVHLKVKVAALAHVGKMFITVPMLRNASDSETNMRIVGNDFVLLKLQLKVVKSRSSHSIWPPEGRMRHNQVRIFFWCKFNFTVLARRKSYKLLHKNQRLPLSGNCSFQYPVHRLRRQIA